MKVAGLKGVVTIESMAFAIDDLCVWKKMENDPDSTTFQIVKEYLALGLGHPLYGCVRCSGYEYGCKGYRLILNGNKGK